MKAFSFTVLSALLLSFIMVLIFSNKISAVSAGVYSHLTDKFASECLSECKSKRSDLPDCNSESISFIVRQYNLAAGAQLERGEVFYPCTDVVRRYNCKEWRSKQLHDLCPATVEKSGIRWTKYPSPL